jgi:hypothetical protein
MLRGMDIRRRALGSGQPKRSMYLRRRILQLQRYIHVEKNKIELEILLAKVNDMEQELKQIDPLEEYCEVEPWADECRVYCD